MLVKDIMNDDVKTITPDSSVQRAAELMSKHRIGSLIVTDKDKLVGIVTERDIMEKLVAEAKNASKVKVKAIMTKEVILISPDADVEEASEIMIKNHIKKLPVVYQNSLVGIVTSMDVVTAHPKMLETLSKLLLIPGRKKLVAG